MNEKLQSFIATRDRRIVQQRPWMAGPLREAFEELLKKGSVKMGGRTTCGPSLDPTWAIFCAWNEVVRKARALGYEIGEEDVKHKNGSPTRSGGFWVERVYTALVTQSADDQTHER